MKRNLLHRAVARRSALSARACAPIPIFKMKNQNSKDSVRFHNYLFNLLDTVFVKIF